MSSSTLESQGLEALLRNLQVETPLPSASISSSPLHNPVDVYRLSLVELISQILNHDKAVVHDAVQRTIVISKGDLALVTPRLKIKGRNPNELAVEIASKVCIV